MELSLIKNVEQPQDTPVKNGESFGMDSIDQSNTAEPVLYSRKSRVMFSPSINDPERNLGIQLDVVNVSYSITLKKKPLTEKRLLKNINFRLDPGEMCALMGPSGAGKSTLLDLIADRKLEGKWSGEVYVNGKFRSKWFNRQSSYVLQDDFHLPMLTVEETLYYAAWTRMDEFTTKQQREKRTELLLHLMGLNHVKNSRVGDELNRGISGGQLKRLSIAVEIVSLPNLIFLDEPTSGLDSSIALEVMSTVRKLADQNRTIISTIHQPSPEVFNLFHKVALLCDGRLIYFGPAKNVFSYFTLPELNYRPGNNENPAEFMLNIAGGEIYPEGANFLRIPAELESIFQQSEQYKQLSKAIDNDLTSETLLPQVAYSRRHASGKSTQFLMLYHRAILYELRDSTTFWSQIGKNIIIAVVSGIVFYGQSDIQEPLYVNGVQQAVVNNVNSLLFFMIMFLTMNNSQIISAVCSKLILYRREMASFAYAAFPAWFVQVTQPLYMIFLNLFLYCIIIFPLTGFPWKFFAYIFFLAYLGNIAAFYVCILLASLLKDASLAFSVFPLAFMFLAIFAGFVIAVNDIPAMWIWMAYISFARWMYQGYLCKIWNEYEGGDQVLQTLGFDGYNANNSFPIVLAISVFLAVLIYFSMRPPVSKLVQENEEAIKRNKRLSFKNGDTNQLNQQLIQNYHPHEHESFAFPATTTYTAEWYQKSTGEVKTSKGCRLLFRNLSYTVPDMNKRTYFVKNTAEVKILKEVSGRVLPGEMCALMGGSGCGKSTLLDVLAGRKTQGTITGDLYFDGIPRNSIAMCASAYVMQDNIHFASLTVRETLMYSCYLRLKQKTSYKQRVQRVEKVMKMLGLNDHGETIVGNSETRGLSGGQLKRLSIGVEIINLPGLIFLDEPTTGLDSTIALEVMSAVRNLANQNRTIIASIHQPSKSVFELFDKLLLLAHGKVIYFGPSRDIVTYFTTSVYRFSYIEGTNPADYFVSIAAGVLEGANKRKVTEDELANYYLHSDINKLFRDSFDSLVDLDKAGTAAANKKPLDKSVEFPTAVWFQAAVLCHRILKTLRNNPRVPIATFVRHIFIALFYGSIFYKLDGGTASTAYTNRMSVLFFSITVMVMSRQQNIPEFFDRRVIFYRERASKCYGAFPYWLSCWVVDIPFVMLNIVAFTTILYYMVGFNTASGCFSRFYGQILLDSFNGLFIAQLMSASTSSPVAAVGMYPVILFIQMAFSGYIVFLSSLPVWLSTWGPYLSFVRFSFQTLILNEFDNNPNLPLSETYIQLLGFDTYSIDQTAPVPFVFVIGFAIMFLLALQFISYENR